MAIEVEGDADDVRKLEDWLWLIQRRIVTPIVSITRMRRQLYRPVAF
jgi:hypothetical protein